MTNINFYSLRDIVDEKRGICYGIVQPGSSVDNGVPIIKVNNIVSANLSENNVDKISNVIENKYSRSRLQGGEILISLVGSLGYTMKATNKMSGWNVARAVGILPIKKQFDPDWVLWYLRSPEAQEIIRNLASESVQATLNLKELSGIKIPMPDSSIRKPILDILSSLDNKIELNRRMNQTLEQLAQTLFQQWFVAFDFPNATGQPYRSSGGELVESELGEIPKGWRIERLEHIASVNNRTLNPKKAPQSILYIDIASVSTGKVDTITDLIFEEAPSRARRIIKNGDVIWSTVRPNRRAFFLALDIEPNTITSTGFAVLSPIAVPFSFLYLLTTTEEFTNYLVSNATGSTYPAVNSSVFAAARITVPDENVLRQFHNIVAPLLKRINHNEIQSRTLATLRDKLLPQLLSGRLTVRQAAEMVA